MSDQIYSWRFEVKPGFGSRYADRGTIDEYELNVVGRWNRLVQTIIPKARIKFQQQKFGFGNLGLYCQIGEFDGEDYILARLKDMSQVFVPAPTGLAVAYDPEFEVLLVTDSRSLPDIAREIMEPNPPDFVAIREVKRLYLAERNSSFSIMVREGIL